MLQPVVARFVARSRSLGEPPARRAAIFQLYLYQSLGLGLALAALAWLGRGPLAGWLNVPVAAIGLAAAAGVAFLARPVVNGMLQGQERFALFGLAHTVYASGRLLTALALVGWLGAAALGGVAAMVTGLFLALVAQAASWWGGWSFGPRLLTDLWPGIILLTAIVWAAVARQATPRRARFWATAYLALALPALFFHAGLGLNSRAASRWNGAIDPVSSPGAPLDSDLFNWHYTQVAASNAMLCRLAGDDWQHAGLPLESLAPYRMGQRIAPSADQTTRWPPAGSDAAEGSGSGDGLDHGAGAGLRGLRPAARPAALRRQLPSGGRPAGPHGRGHDRRGLAGHRPQPVPGFAPLAVRGCADPAGLSLIHISEPTRPY